MSISRYRQSTTLTNVNAQLTIWFKILTQLTQQPTNDTNQQLLFGMIA